MRTIVSGVCHDQLLKMRHPAERQRQRPVRPLWGAECTASPADGGVHAPASGAVRTGDPATARSDDSPAAAADAAATDDRRGDDADSDSDPSRCRARRPRPDHRGLCGRVCGSGRSARFLVPLGPAGRWRRRVGRGDQKYRRTVGVCQGRQGRAEESRG